ncbi:hypothetical protein FHT86_000971 [Rhizobium sp. BK313]|uniref:hypothetical protein n=1 Tax=Rhizobium sp. BK313 TaxID=2587081 RepID=UPI00106112B3|nr:hypothetical protein [Rhizobium sp. BK313]MBB3452715.1 hypothetical protein [Rhizobium sp. BK313]
MREDINNSKKSPDADAAISAAHLLHPGSHFGHPRDVLAADISDDEKRAILASWASDIFAIESIPALRLYPGTDKAVSYDEIIEALRSLDARDQQSATQSTSSSFDVPTTHRRRPRSRRFGGVGPCSYRKGEFRRQLFEM